MNSDQRITTLAKWGQYMSKDLNYQEDLWQQAQAENGWFTAESIKTASQAIITAMLQEKQLEQWLGRYPSSSATSPKTIGLVLAGNLPLVGFHDVLCVLASGHKAQVKMSSKDKVLLPYWIERLAEIDSTLAGRVQFVDRLEGFDAVIATGNNNSARYFNYYFGKVPHIIRKNRSAAAILTGEESPAEMAALGQDMFTYFGLGCRNVSKWWIPEALELPPLLDQLQSWEKLMDHHKWKNNYDYHRSLLLLNKTPHLATGFMMLVENEAVSAPLSVIHYSRYTNAEDLDLQIRAQRQNIQCMVSNYIDRDDVIPLGTSQQPSLWDYADKEDTMAFLLHL